MKLCIGLKVSWSLLQSVEYLKVQGGKSETFLCTTKNSWSTADYSELRQSMMECGWSTVGVQWSAAKIWAMSRLFPLIWLHLAYQHRLFFIEFFFSTILLVSNCIISIFQADHKQLKITCLVYAFLSLSLEVKADGRRERSIQIYSI
jgi:hypothetical protein